MAQPTASDLGGCSYGGVNGSLFGGSDPYVHYQLDRTVHSDPYIHYQLDRTVHSDLGTVFNVYTCASFILFTCALLYMYIIYII